MIMFIPKDDWRGVVAYANVHIEGQDLLVIDPGYNSIPYNYYQPDVAPQWVPIDQLEEAARVLLKLTHKGLNPCKPSHLSVSLGFCPRSGISHCNR